MLLCCRLWLADRRSVRSLADSVSALSGAVLDQSAFCASELSHVASHLDRPASRDVERELTAAISAVRSTTAQLPAAATLAHARLDGCIALSQSLTLHALCPAASLSVAACSAGARHMQ